LRDVRLEISDREEKIAKKMFTGHDDANIPFTTSKYNHLVAYRNYRRRIDTKLNNSG
jgi:hypothetical protein